MNKPLACVLSAAVLVAVTGCANNIAGYQARARPMPYKIEPYAFLAQDDYTYYPQYETYYSERQHEYAYWDNGSWVLRPTFAGVPVNVLLASPSVKMTFHDAPDNHHALIMAEYPRTWNEPMLALSATKKSQ